MSDVWYRGLDRPNLDMLKEGQISGALSGRLAQLFSLANAEEHMAHAPISIDPGDMVFVGGDNSPGMALSLPIAYDVWYLWHTVNVMPEDQDEQDEFIKMVLDPIFKHDHHGRPHPLRTLKRKDISEKGVVPDLSFFQNKGTSYIKEMRFETFLHNRSPLYSSPGPKRINNPEIDHEGQGIADVYAGYLAFPVGPLGVMRVISLISESLLAREEYQVEDDSLMPETGEQLLTPLHEQNDDCMGNHLAERTYLVNNPDAEYPAKTMAGVDAVLPHHWMRYWLIKEGTWPVPGEFVGMLAKAQGLPPHCWWYQITNPLLYAGQFFETEYYTSGVVLAVIEEVDRDREAGTATYEVTGLSSEHDQRTGHGEYVLSRGEQFTWAKVGNVYKVRVKDQDLYLQPSDFLAYEIDTRVAVRKVPGKRDKNFTWDGLEPGRKVPGKEVQERMDYDAAMSGQSFEINKEWAIVPITFYSEG